MLASHAYESVVVEDTREDPDFDDPGDLNFSVEQEEVMHAAYEVFEKEVSGSHDEPCCKAGEYMHQERARAHKDDKQLQVCRDKSQGPSLHVAPFSVEW